ncbi:MAG: hypothetical protein M3Y21_06195 [Candidatus Eremiobacteraeota bacterium]|nr:hypothetical protein [Candidatus Eremiobacteraeota bacterium]
MALLRGKGQGLEVVFADRDFDDALAELQLRLDEQAGFYRGSKATAALGDSPPTGDQVGALRAMLERAGVELTGLSGQPAYQAIALASGLEFVPASDGSPAVLSNRRALRPKRSLKLSDAAKSLAADFAGARQDRARRVSVGEVQPRPVALKLVEQTPPGEATLYHHGTLRGGQSLHNVGHIVLIGDLNPGAELIAGGDIVVFGSLRGVAHAGAQGDAGARVYALDLAPTQLRIGSLIAVDSGERKRPHSAEAAFTQDGQIAIAPYDKIALLAREEAN